MLKINQNERVTWQGKFRPALNDEPIYPRLENKELTIWLGTGGNPASSVRAAKLHLPVMYGVIGGEITRFAPLANLYRQSAKKFGAPEDKIQVAIGTPGFVNENSEVAKDTFWKGWHERAVVVGPTRGFEAPPREWFDEQAKPGGAMVVGTPEEVAERIVDSARVIGQKRHILEMDWGHMPHKDFLHSIELLGTKVKPLVDKELGGNGTN